MLRRRLLLLALLAPAACGEAAQPAAAPARDAAADRRAIQERTSAYLNAYVSGDGERACDQFTPAQRRIAEQRTRAAGTTCAELLGEVGPGLLESVPAGERPAAIRRISNPANVRVELSQDRAMAGLAPAREGRVPARVELERVGDRWLISRLGVRAVATP